MKVIIAAQYVCCVPRILDCGCSSAAVNSSCDQTTGQCYCTEGAIGITCNECLPYNEIVEDNGCQSCDQCVLNLTDASNVLALQVSGVVSDAMLAVGLQDADTLNIDDVSAAIKMQQSLYDDILANITEINKEIGGVQNDSAALKALLDSQQQEVTERWREE